MSGSSLDGVDIAAVNFDHEDSYKIIGFETYEFEASLYRKLKSIRNSSAIEYFHIGAEYSNFIATIIQKFNEKFNIKPKLTCIHGHTIYHNPKYNISKQMIEGGIIAGKTEIDTLVDFRIQDITTGGQGAPLVPIVEKLLGNQGYFLNLGGIANISIHNQSKCIAYDIAPCNQLFNAIANKENLKYDKNGIIGSKGTVDTALLNKWLINEFFSLKFPKSIDNQWLDQNFISNLPNLKTEDLLATAYEFVATIISNEIKLHTASDNKELLITGGGAHNTFFINLIQEKLNTIGVSVIIPSNLLIDAKEALLMAYMGYLYIMNKPNTLPSVTGSGSSHISGAYYKGSKLRDNE